MSVGAIKTITVRACRAGLKIDIDGNPTGQTPTDPEILLEAFSSGELLFDAEFFVSSIVIDEIPSGFVRDGGVIPEMSTIQWALGEYSGDFADGVGQRVWYVCHIQLTYTEYYNIIPVMRMSGIITTVAPILILLSSLIYATVTPARLKKI